MDMQAIPEFYAGRSIFITGASGFVGKVLIEKLLRSCPDISKIYIILREKRGKTVKERMDFTFSDVLFDLVKTEQPGVIERKIIPIKGDLMQLGLGVSKEDYQRIIDSVSVIFHVAASVRFDDSLKDAIILNTRGTRELAQMALAATNLAALVHVSTTYCNCINGTKIIEELYPPPADWRQAIEIAEKFDPDQLAILTAKYMEPYPNTYTFTKALGEHVINDLCLGKIPTIICRPSIVISSLDEPLKGWNDNFNGPIGLLVACGKGLMRSSYIDADIISDFIPVDIVAKSIIVASWYMAIKQCLTKVEVMHSSSGYHKWMTMGELIKLGRNLSRDYPLNDLIWVPKGFITKIKLIAYYRTVLFHLIPALFLDLGLKFMGHKPLLMKLQTKIYNASLQLRYFTNQEWEFGNNKMFKLITEILPQDEQNWCFDFRSANAELFIRNSIIGARKYLLKESDETLAHARVHYNRMYWVDKVAMFFLYSFPVWVVYKLDLINVITTGVANWYESLFTLENV